MIIIGAGLAGLSTGIYAQLNGYRCHILEHHSQAGGVAAAWRRDGYLIDGGIHFLMGHRPGSKLYSLYEELGIAQSNRFLDLDTYVRVWDEKSGRRIDFTSDLDRLLRDLKEFAPSESAFADRFVADVRRMQRGYDSGDMLADKPHELSTLIDRIRMFWRMRKILRFFGGAYARPIGENPYEINDPALRKVVENLFLPEVPAWFVLMILALVANKEMGVIEGGCQAFVEPMERRFKALGGEITYEATVDKILVEDGCAVGVRLADGEEHRAEIVVSAADGHSTIFQMLDGRFTDKKTRDRYTTWQLCRPTIVVSLGVNMAFPDVPPLQLVLLDEPLKVGDEESKGFSVRLFNYSVGFAPPGRTVVQAMLETEWDYWDGLRNAPAKYQEAKEAAAKSVLTRLERLYPGISTKVELTDVATPYTMWRYTLNWRGAYMGWLISSDNITRTIPRTLPGLSNFYMAGQWVTPGGSVPTSLASGRELVQLLCDHEGRPFRLSS